MKRIILSLAAFLIVPGIADASTLEFALDQVDGEPARIRLLELEGATHTPEPVQTWRIGAERDGSFDGGDGDVRLKLRLRPNRAMGRMSVAF